MKEIVLTKNKIALIDDEDYDKLSKHSWCASQNRAGNWYATSRIDKKIVMMHRFVLNTNNEVDHKNRNGLDNQKSNLRRATRKQNSCNRIGRKGRRFKGVSFLKRLNKWRAYINDNHRKKALGCYSTIEEAAAAYDNVAKQLWGDWALLNFPGA